MRPSELEGHSCTTRESANMILFRGTRQRLTKILIDAGKSGKIYINGETFNVQQFKLVLDCLTSPKD
jgi:hypothetical protein